jgi:hypothetical protein
MIHEALNVSASSERTFEAPRLKALDKATEIVAQMIV